MKYCELFASSKYCLSASHHLSHFLFLRKLGEYKAIRIYFLQVMKYILPVVSYQTTQKENITLTFKNSTLLTMFACFSTLISSNFTCTTSDEELSSEYIQLHFKNSMHNTKLLFFPPLLLISVQVTKACNDMPGELGNARRHSSCKDMKMLVTSI